MGKLAYLLAVISFIAFCSGAEILRPRECEVWRCGFEYTIEWDTEDLDSQVDIELWEDDVMIDTIASATENDGSYTWLMPFYQIKSGADCVPYIFIHSVSGYSASYFITGVDAARSDGFDLRNPITWGNPNNKDPVNVVDTLFKARWSGEIVDSYEIEYRRVGSTSSETVQHNSDREELEDMDEEVISGLQPDTEYEMRMRYVIDGSSSEFTEYQQFRTYKKLECTDEMLSAWFSLEVYDNIRTGEEKYDGFCGEWVTSFAYISKSDFVASYSDRDSGRVFVAWRGTESDNIADAIDNLGILIDCDEAVAISDPLCSLSSGFGLNYKASQSNILRDLVEDAIEAGFTKLIITGHSQGGALATVAASDYAALYGDEIDIELINFGAPEVGNSVYVNRVVSSIPEIIRFVQVDEAGEQDEVALLPSSLGLGFGGDSFLFTQLPDNTREDLECPLDCRIHGFGPIPPFYCHCMRGYWDNMAKRSERNSNYQDVYATYFSEIVSSWFAYSTVPFVTSDLFSFFSDSSYFSSGSPVSPISLASPVSSVSSFSVSVTSFSPISSFSTSFASFSTNSPGSGSSVAAFNYPCIFALLTLLFLLF